MAETATKLPVKTEVAATPSRLFVSLRQEIDRLFEDFDRDFWASPFRRSVFDIEPFWRRELSRAGTPAVNITESEKAYEITAEFPGMMRRTSK